MCVGGIFFKGGMYCWNNIPRELRCKSVVTNPTNGRSTLGVSVGILGNLWNQLYLELVYWNFETVHCLQFPEKFMFGEYFSRMVWLSGIISPGIHIVKVW